MREFWDLLVCYQNVDRLIVSVGVTGTRKFARFCRVSLLLQLVFPLFFLLGCRLLGKSPRLGPNASRLSPIFLAFLLIFFIRYFERCVPAAAESGNAKKVSAAKYFVIL